ncbi:dimethylamine monooxygenase subunit DmmA family protein [Labrys wisconsinensis]|uniref:DNA-directed RNA polymerase subunit RPC12/RpoP n=1 Tax=Labrys wisconsinensis TaxID=425677 RepID=A0ABU0JDS8_9HYPH|nr:dimethylamine monooxygenase subunit DmmA family protein [Labrys wisconsinensis]MDQ0472433.1 DNA-directed RNA polymerase subunit RPC12/RpoP [Labrys wisconsinensis]
MLVQGIKSRPVYGTLKARPAGPLHLFVADGEGAQAILDMAAGAPAGFFGKAHIVYIPGGAAPKAYGDKLAALKPDQFYQGPSIAAALPRLAQTLATARMGTQVYLAGTEGLIGQAMKVALEAGIDHTSMQTEHRGSEARRVQCVHCKGITEDVRTQPVVCAHCGLTLLVRDHYSRRIAAFQGVRIDAEEPGVIPPTEELFP